MCNKENTIKALEMIQSIISRMATNSFALKGWAISILAGIFVLSSRDVKGAFYLLSFMPIIFFWLLDTYYLMKERQFRNLYNWTRIQTEDSIDFDLSVNRDELKTIDAKYFRCLISITEIGFYFPLSILTLFIINLMVF